MKNETIYSKEYLNSLDNYDLKGHGVFRLAISLVRPKSKVLVVGVSPREIKFLENIKCKITGVEVNKQIFDECKKINSKCKLINGDALKFKRRNSFDYVLGLWNVINYMSKDERKEFLIWAYDNLNNNGKLIITTTDKYKSLRSVFKFLYDFIFKSKITHISKKELDELFNRYSNFKVTIFKINGEYLIIGEK